MSHAASALRAGCCLHSHSAGSQPAGFSPQVASHQSTLICEVGSVGVHVILKPRVGTSSSPPRSSRLSSSALAVWHLHKEPSHCLGVHVLSHLVRVRVRDRLRVRVTVTVTVTVTVRVRVRGKRSGKPLLGAIFLTLSNPNPYPNPNQV